MRVEHGDEALLDLDADISLVDGDGCVQRTGREEGKRRRKGSCQRPRRGWRAGEYRGHSQDSPEREKDVVVPLSMG